MNIVGTPYSAVQRSRLRPPPGSGRDRTRAPGSPSWRRGWCSPGCPSPCRSSGRTAPGCTADHPASSLISSVTKKPLLRMLRCDSVAPFGKPVVPEVYWMLIGSVLDRLGHPRPQLVRAHPLGAVTQVCPSRRVPRNTTSRSPSALRPDLLDHAHVVRGLERRRSDQRSHPRLVEHVSEFVRAVGRIDVDQDRADLGRRVLDDGPLRAVRRPDADAVTLLRRPAPSNPVRRRRSRR